MSVLSVKNLQEVLVGKNIGRTASVQITDPAATGYIADGEIVVLNSSGQIYDSATMSYSTSPYIRIAQRSGNNVIITNKIYGNKLFTYTGQGADAQGTEQITHIGYNGTTGSFDLSSSNDFYVTITPNQDDMQWSEQKQKDVILAPKSLVGTSQLTFASTVVQSVMKKYVNDGLPVTAVMLNSGTAAVLTGAATISVTHGSNVLVPNAAITNVGFGAGTMVRIGVTGSGVGTGIPVYTVVGPHPVIANAWLLNAPYAGPTNAALAVANAGVVTAGANYGIRFVGKNLPFTLDFFKFKRVSFTVQMQNLGTTPLVKTQNSTYGQGDGRLVAEEESFCKGFQGALNRMTVPLPAITIDANSTTTTALNTTYADAFVTATQLYETVQISFYDENLHTTTASVKMPETVKLFLIPAAAQNKAANTGILTALDDWMASTPNAFAGIVGLFS